MTTLRPDGSTCSDRYTLAGAQTGAKTGVPGHAASFDIDPTGVTTISYFATDAAGNKESGRTLDVKLEAAFPILRGLPAQGCTVWPANHKPQQVAVLRASDAVSGIARGSFQVKVTSNEVSTRATWRSANPKTAGRFSSGGPSAPVAAKQAEL